MNDMVERVARALYENPLHLGDGSSSYAQAWDQPSSDMQRELRDGYRKLARTAIAALCDATDEMIEAGDAEFYEWMSPDKTWTRDLVKNGWRAMIDAALKPK